MLSNLVSAFHYRTPYPAFCPSHPSKFHRTTKSVAKCQKRRPQALGHGRIRFPVRICREEFSESQTDHVPKLPETGLLDGKTLGTQCLKARPRSCLVSVRQP